MESPDLSKFNKVQLLLKSDETHLLIIADHNKFSQPQGTFCHILYGDI